MAGALAAGSVAMMLFTSAFDVLPGKDFLSGAGLTSIGAGTGVFVATRAVPKRLSMSLDWAVANVPQNSYKFTTCPSGQELLKVS